MKDWTEELFMNLPEPEAGETPSPVYPFAGTPQDAQERTKQSEDGGQDIIDREGPGTSARGKKAGKIDAPIKPPVYATPEERQIAKTQERIREREEAQTKEKPKKQRQRRRTFKSREEAKAARKEYLANYKRKSKQVNAQIFFSAENDALLLKHLEQQENKTDYIRQLILADMDRQNAARHLAGIRKDAPKKPH